MGWKEYKSIADYKYLLRYPGEVANLNTMTSGRIWSSASDPSVNNDGTDSAGIKGIFEVGDVWHNRTANELSLITDNTQGAAVWKLMISTPINDNVLLSFGTDSDYSLVYSSVNDSFQIVNGATVDTDIRVELDSAGIVQFFNRIKHPGVYGSIYVNDGSTAQTIATGTTPVVLTGFTTDGLSSNVENDAANDKITITKAGVYKVGYSCSFASPTAGSIWHVVPAINGVVQVQAESHRKIGTANDVGSMSGIGIIDVTTVPWDLDLRAHHNNGGSIDFEPEDMSLVAEYLGET